MSEKVVDRQSLNILSAARSTITRLPGLIFTIGVISYVVIAGMAASVITDWPLGGPNAFGWDNSIYVIMARNLAAGLPLGMSNHPDNPIVYPYPPGYPLVLSPVWLLWPEFPDNLLAMQGLSVIFMAASALFVFLYLCRFRYTSPWVALAISLLTLANPLLLRFGLELLLSEPLYGLISILGLCALDRYIGSTKPSPISKGIPVVLALTAAAAVRSVGMTLVVAALVSMLLFRQWRKAAFLFVGFALTMSLLLWLSHGGGYVRYGQDFSKSVHDVTTSLHMVASNLKVIAVEVANHLMPGLSSSTVFRLSESYELAALFGAIRHVITIVTFLGLALSIVKWRSPWAIYVVIYLAVMVVWPSQYAQGRLVGPVLPFLALALVKGLDWCLRAGLSSYRGKWRLALEAKFVPAVVLIGLLVSILGGLAVARVMILENAFKAHMVYRDHAPAWRETQRLIGWVKENTDREAVLGATAEWGFYLYSNRPTVDIGGYRATWERAYSRVDGFSPAEAIEYLPDQALEVIRNRKVQYVLQMPFYHTAHRVIKGWGVEVAVTALQLLQQRYPDLLTLAFQSPSDPDYSIWKVNPAYWR